MPFGKKPQPDDCTYNLGKVYRVIITLCCAGSRPQAFARRLARDSDMSKDVRDRSIVLADA
jgi:hypothetical protein